MKMNPPARSSRPISRKKPRIMRHPDICRPERPSANTGRSPEIQPHQHLTRPFPPPARLFGGGQKALTVQDAPSIRPSMAAGAIPPPLFFEQRRFREHLASVHDTSGMAQV